MAVPAALPSEAAPEPSLPDLPDVSCDGADRPTALDGPMDLVLGTCSGIRPGARVSIAGGCTMSWILRSGADYYATIAGHCGSVGQTVRAANGTAIGTMVYSVNQPIGEDFGVFKIYSSRNSWVNPKMCGWGGPTGVWTGALGVPVVRHFGFGIGFGDVPSTRARSGVLDYSNPTTFAFAGTVSPGDSGSPARLQTGEALGVITDLLAPRTPGTGPLVPADPVLLTQLAIGTRLDYGLSEASAALGIPLTLVTAPVDNEPV